MRLQAGFATTSDGPSAGPGATDETGASGETGATGESSTGSETAAEPEYEVRMDQAQRPGIYRIRRFTPEGNSRDTLVAMNPPITEKRAERR